MQNYTYPCPYPSIPITIDCYSVIYRPTCSFIQSTCRDDAALPTPLQIYAINVSLLTVAGVLNTRREVQLTVQLVMLIARLIYVDYTNLDLQQLRPRHERP